MKLLVGAIALLLCSHVYGVVLLDKRPTPPGLVKLKVKTGGLRCTGNNTGAGFLMYSRENVNTRWRRDPYQDDFRVHSASNFVCIRRAGEMWQFDTNWADEGDRSSNQSWNPFIPKSTDIAVASVDFGTDVIIDLKFKKALVSNGLTLGYSTGDINFFSNQDADGNNATGAGDFRINGTYILAFPFEPEPPENPTPPPAQPVVLSSGLTRLPVMTGGIRCTDNNTGTGFIMYSLQDINVRWTLDKTQKDFREHSARNFLCVRWRDSNWWYDTNWEDEVDRKSNVSWHKFIPAPTDILVAEVDYDKDTITDMKGTKLSQEGITLGYSDGDLSFVPNQGASGQFDRGEFRVVGSNFVAYVPAPPTTTTTTTTTPPKPTTTTTEPFIPPKFVRVEIVSGGIRCSDKNLGAGFIMYTKKFVNDRFKSKIRPKVFMKHDGKSFVCVRYQNKAWQYDTNWEDEVKKDPRVKDQASWRNFTPAATDAVVATVDFTTKNIRSLSGANMKYQGMRLGYASGDIRVDDGEKDKSFNDYGADDHAGEFRIIGSYMNVWWPR
eukprot:TRINITY_DN94022_c0_g1_i1.p1 TRINITY_DN94022_c0_g1~~TRINITY_DN94022_c0_g1_i1.p1  ORF type:complete len:550 (+),score=86.92 TRINITY_DN94022_c0_g1_i1:74-1723(+)